MLSTENNCASYLKFIIGGLSEIPWWPLVIQNFIADQLSDLSSHVEALRPFRVKIMFSLLSMRGKTVSDYTK